MARFVISTAMLRVRDTSIRLAGLGELTKAIGYNWLAGAYGETLDGL